MKQNYQFKLALSPNRIEAYFLLRQQIFCQEQGIFEKSDRDDYDSIAYPIVAINHDDRVVGVVRIYEPEPGLWYGGRLGVHPDYRRGWKIGKGLMALHHHGMVEADWGTRGLGDWGNH